MESWLVEAELQTPRLSALRETTIMYRTTISALFVLDVANRFGRVGF